MLTWSPDPPTFLPGPPWGSCLCFWVKQLKTNCNISCCSCLPQLILISLSSTELPVQNTAAPQCTLTKSAFLRLSLILWRKFPIQYLAQTIVSQKVQYCLLAVPYTAHLILPLPAAADTQLTPVLYLWDMYQYWLQPLHNTSLYCLF